MQDQSIGWPGGGSDQQQKQLIMIDEREAYDAYLIMIKENKISDWFTNQFTITADDLHLIEQVSRLMQGATTTHN